MLHFLAQLGHAYISVITLLFMLGAVGCVAVLILTFWEDMKTLAGKGEPDARDIRPDYTRQQARPGTVGA